MASTPAFIGTARIGIANGTAAGTAIDGTGSIIEVLAGAATGTRVLEVDVKCAATSAAAIVNLFLSADSGSSWRVFDSIAIAAGTPSTTVASVEASATYQNLVLPGTAHRLGFMTTIAQSTNVYALGGDL